MFWDTMDFCMKLLKAKWEVNQQEGGEEFKCYMIRQMIVAMLHSNGQLRTDRERWRYGERMSKTYCTTEDYWTEMKWVRDCWYFNFCNCCVGLHLCSTQTDWLLSRCDRLRPFPGNILCLSGLWAVFIRGQLCSSVFCLSAWKLII